MGVGYIYTCLDSIFDTRTSILVRHFPDIFGEMLEAGYPSRASDVPRKGLEAKWIEYWAKRDRSLLADSKTTKALDIIKEFCLQLGHNDGVDPEAPMPGVIINVWPYVLSKEDSMSIVSGIRAVTDVHFEHKVININPKKLDCSWFKNESIGKILMYEYPVWLDFHAGNSENGAMPDIEMISPSIGFKTSPEDTLAADKEIREASGMTMERMIVSMARPVVGLILVDPLIFSIDLGCLGNYQQMNH